MRHSYVGRAIPRFKPIDDDVSEYRLELESLARYLLEPGAFGGGDVTLPVAVGAIPGFVGVGSVRLWLHRIAASEAGRRRGARRGGMVDAYLDSLVAGRTAHRPLVVEPLAREIALRMRVLEAFASLPGNYRCALLLKDGEGLPVGQVARLMGTTAASARSVLYRARQALRDPHPV